MSPNSEGNNGPWFGVSLLLIGLIIGYVVGGSLSGGIKLPGGGGTVANDNNPPDNPAPTGTAPATGVGPTLGDANAKVTLVEFTDFQCPFCQRHFTQTFGQIKSEYVDTGKIKYELRNFPLTSIHPNAEIGAEAAMCADKQGKFWEMHDKLFSDHDNWSNQQDPTATLKQYAASIGLSASAFSSCLTNHDTQAEVQKDAADGSASGINGTPGFWVISSKGSQFISGAVPFTSFKTAIDKLL